jgi:hypothetical protein
MIPDALRRTLQQLQTDMRQRHPEKPRGRGRPPLEISPSLVIGLAAAGRTARQIAAVIPCDPKTILKRFKRELALGYARQAGALKLAAYQAALEDKKFAALKTMLHMAITPMASRMSAIVSVRVSPFVYQQIFGPGNYACGYGIDCDLPVCCVLTTMSAFTWT